jgi:hypothetical protein
LTDFVFVDKNRLEVFNHAGDRLIQRKLDSCPNSPPVVRTPDGKTFQLGLTLAARQEILLLNPDGSLCDGFPLRGQSAFTIGVLDKNTHYKNLLVGSDDSYLFNYAIQ